MCLKKEYAYWGLVSTFLRENAFLLCFEGGRYASFEGGVSPVYDSRGYVRELQYPDASLSQTIAIEIWTTNPQVIEGNSVTDYVGRFFTNYAQFLTMTQ